MRLVLVVVFATCVAALAACKPAGDWRAEVAAWKPRDPLPRSLPLVDQRGRAFTVGDLKGEPLAVGFVFTHCTVETACPLTAKRMVEAARVAAETRRAMHLLVVTIDPERDTPPVLAAYAQRFGAGDDVTFATGDPEALRAFASLFNVVAVAGEGTLAHPVKVALADKDLVVQRQWTDNRFLPKEIVDATVAQ